MDCERPKGKTVTIVGATGRMDAHYPWLRHRPDQRCRRMPRPDKAEG
jgi:hypothetical protein